MDNLSIGLAAEQQAQEYLEKRGLTAEEKNYSYYARGKKQGEIDLIMHDKDCIVFVEVKKRKQTDHGQSLEMISQSKQSRLRRTALHYLQEKQLLDKMPCRFDVIGIDGDNITWVANAIETNH